MSLDLLILRPSYQKLSEGRIPQQITSLHVQSPTPPMQQASPVTSIHQKRIAFPKPVLNSPERGEGQLKIQLNIKRQRIQQAYNTLSDFNDKKQIVNALKSLNTADERIQLIDKILERKEEMQIATLRFKAKKLEPIFNVIRRKLKITKQVKENSTTSPHNTSKKQTLLIDQSQPNIPPQLPPKEELTEQQQQILDKLQAKYTTSFAFSWLTNRYDSKPNSEANLMEDNSPGTAKRRERRNSALQGARKANMIGLNQIMSKKVSENSDEMIRLGKLKSQDLVAKSRRINVSQAKPKVDTGVRKQKKRPTLLYVTNERQENQKHNDEFRTQQNQILMRRNQEK
ncbi:hypothetical protein pb186bvf_005613 [Paramecium bursaria]